MSIAAGAPLYVIRLDAANRRVIVGPRDALRTRSILLRDINWIGDGSIEQAVASGRREVFVKVRSTRAPQPGWLAFFIKLAVAVSVMGAMAWFGQAQFDWAAMKVTPALRIGALLGIITACAFAYFAVLAVLGFRPRDFRRRAN